MGQASGDILAGLPDTIVMLFLGVTDDERLKALMSKVVTLKQLEWLCEYTCAHCLYVHKK